MANPNTITTAQPIQAQADELWRVANVHIAERLHSGPGLSDSRKRAAAVTITVLHALRSAPIDPEAVPDPDATVVDVASRGIKAALADVKGPVRRRFRRWQAARFFSDVFELRTKPQMRQLAGLD